MVTASKLEAVVVAIRPFTRISCGIAAGARVARLGAVAVLAIVTGVAGGGATDAVRHPAGSDAAGLARPGLQGVGFHLRHVIHLSEIGRKGHYLAVIGFDQPLEYYRRIEAARICQNHFLNCCLHNFLLFAFPDH